MVVFLAKVFVFGQKLLYSDKVVLFGQKWMYSDKVGVFGKGGFIRTIWLYSGK